MKVEMPASIAELQKLVRGSDRLLIVGGGSKARLPDGGGEDPGATVASPLSLSGIVEYNPQEYTISAKAGTRLSELEWALAEHGQFLPFVPPFAQQGATVGGMLATGLSGWACQRFGLVRDFVIGVELIDGLGQRIRGGGKVVKNAAGFDLPKLMTGSLGQLGVITEACFKVFPRPAAYRALRFRYDSFGQAMAGHQRLLSETSFELDGLLLSSEGELRIRVGGLVDSLPQRAKAIAAFLGREAEEQEDGDAEAGLWQGGLESWLSHPRRAALKAPVKPSQLLPFESAFAERSRRRLYCNLGSTAWALLDEGEACPAEGDGWDGLLLGRGWPALVGSPRSNPFYARLRQALDPKAKFSSGIHSQKECHAT